MKLSKENIQFIDNYLQNNEVFYVDIRFEMIDYIATVVETKMQKEGTDFYDAFKNYIIANKKDILKNNKIGLYIFKYLIIRFLKFLFQPILMVVIYLFFNQIELDKYSSKNFIFGNLLFVIILLIVIFQLIYFHIVLKNGITPLKRQEQFSL